MVSSWFGETLTSIKGILDVLFVVLTIALAVVGGLRIYLDHELGRRRATRENILVKRSEDLTSEVQAHKRDLEAERKKLEELRERDRPRDIPEEKRPAILQVLRRAKGGVKISYGGDPEIKTFAQRLVSLVREANWQVTEEEGAPLGVNIRPSDCM
jgi:hypothetical protein